MSSTRSSTLVRWAAVAVMVGAVAACGGDDDDADEGAEDGAGAGVETDPVDPEPSEPSEPAEEAVSDEAVDSSTDAGDATDESSDAGSGADAGPPEVDTGTVVVGGESSTLTGPSRSDTIIDPDLGDSSGDFDFEICETVNPAFAGDFNIAGTLNDGTPFRLGGNVGDSPADLEGFVLGATFEEEPGAITAITLDGRTLSGTASSSRGDVEFTFTC